MTSRSTSLSDEPEIIPARDPIEADKEFVKISLANLLKSIAITLEDKARVIQLLQTHQAMREVVAETL